MRKMQNSQEKSLRARGETLMQVCFLENNLFSCENHRIL